MNINGFEIDKYNQYGLQEGATNSICPICSSTRKKSSEKCMSLDWITGLGTCHHCGEVIQLHTFKKQKGNELKEYKKPPRWNKTTLSDKVVNWFKDRGISQFTLQVMKIGEGKEFMPQVKSEINTIKFNYFEDGELVNIKYRDGAKHFKMFKDAKLIFYNLDSITYSKDCVIVEGEMDCLSYVECGIMNVVSVPNGSTLKSVNLEYLDNCIDYFENKERIYLALDNDEAGQNVTKELIRRLGSERCFLVDFKDCKDANEYLVRYGKDSLKNSLNEAKEVPLIGVSSVSDWDTEYDNYLMHGMNSGYKCGITSFDNIFSTYTGQHITITGIPSSGKSDFVDQMCIGYNKAYGWKIAYASPENKPNMIHAGKLEAKICGEWVHKKEQIRSDWHKKAKEFINTNFKFIDLDTYDLESILDKAKELVKRVGIKCLVIDPYNKVRLKSSLHKNITDYTNDYLCKIDEFARQNDILIILVAHPRKPQVGESKNYEPTFYDIKGGGEFYDMSPHGILVHRDYEHSMVKIKVLKVKFSHLGDNNAHCWLRWNEMNGRYSDYEIQNELPDLCDKIINDNSNWITKQNTETFEIFQNYTDEDLPEDF